MGVSGITLIFLALEALGALPIFGGNDIGDINIFVILNICQ